MLLTFLHHSDGETFLEAAKLAAIPSSFIDGTVLVSKTDVLGSLLHGALWADNTRHGETADTHAARTEQTVNVHGLEPSALTATVWIVSQLPGQIMTMTPSSECFRTNTTYPEYLTRQRADQN